VFSKIPARDFRKPHNRFDSVWHFAQPHPYPRPKNRTDNRCRNQPQKASHERKEADFDGAGA
jgi:hypothetical protein